MQALQDNPGLYKVVADALSGKVSQSSNVGSSNLNLASPVVSGNGSNNVQMMSPEQQQLIGSVV